MTAHLGLGELAAHSGVFLLLGLVLWGIARHVRLCPVHPWPALVGLSLIVARQVLGCDVQRGAGAWLILTAEVIGLLMAEAFMALYLRSVRDRLDPSPADTLALLPPQLDEARPIPQLVLLTSDDHTIPPPLRCLPAPPSANLRLAA
jgi:hypothetical protein